MFTRKNEIEKVAEWIRNASKELYESDECACYNWEIEGTSYSISVGWSSGFDDEDVNDGLMHSKSEPEYCICAAIKLYNPCDCADFGFMDMPYNKETGDVWDTEHSIYNGDDCVWCAKWLLSQLDDIINYFGEDFTGYKAKRNKKKLA